MAHKRGFYMIMEPDEPTKAISFKEGDGVWFNPTFNTRNDAYKFAFKSSLDDNAFQVVEISIGLV